MSPSTVAPSDAGSAGRAPEVEGPTRVGSLTALALSALAAALLLWPVLFGGRSTQSFALDDPRFDVRPWATATEPGELPERVNPVTPDIDLFVLPGVARVAQLRAKGAAPWWDGHQLLGYPLAANQPYPLFSPFDVVTRMTGPITALDVLLWLHLALAGWLAWRAARLLGAEPAAAALAGVGFALSTWMVTRWHLPQIAHTTTWGAGLVGAWAQARRGRPGRAAFEGALFLGLALVSGFPQVALALAGGWLLLLAGTGWTRRDGRRPLLAGTLLALVAGLLLATTPTRVSADAYEHSLRSSAETRAGMAGRGLLPGAMLGLLYPEYFGRMSDFSLPDPPAPTVQRYLPRELLLSDDLQDNPVENALYPGVMLLLLLPALWGCRTARPLLLLALASVAGCLAWPWIVARVPAATSLGAGNIKRMLVLLHVALPLGGALALQRVLRGEARIPWRWGLGLAALLLGVVVWSRGLGAGRDDRAAFLAALDASAWRQLLLLAACLGALALARRALAAPSDRVRLAVWLPALVLAFDLAGLARAFNPFPEQGPAFPPTPALEQLAAREGRVAVLGSDNLLPPTAAALHGLRLVHGVAPMVSRRTVELLEAIEAPLVERADPRIVHPFTRPDSTRHPLLDLLGVSTVVHGDAGLVSSLAVEQGLPLVAAHESEGLAWHARPAAGPRAFVCGGARIEPDAAARLAALGRPTLQPFATVWLERDPGPTLGGSLPTSGDMAPATVVRDEPLELGLSTDAPFPGILVLTEAWDPGWSVTLDGAAAQVLVADHALLGVAVPAGAHHVLFRYAPPGLFLSRVLTVLGLLLLAGLAWRAPSIDRAAAQAAGLGATTGLTART